MTENAQLRRSFRLVCSPERMPLVEALLKAQGFVFEPEPFSPLARRLIEEPFPLGGSLAAIWGFLYIQDRSSMLPPLALAPEAGASVLDCCASPGNKTTPCDVTAKSRRTESVSDGDLLLAGRSIAHT